MFLDTAFYQGEYAPLDQIKVSARDLSIHRGYSIFDFFRYYEGYAYLDWYFDRFYQSAEIVNLSVPYDRDELKTICHQLLVKNNAEECFIKLILSAGVSDDGFSPSGSADLFAITSPYRTLDASLHEYGSNLITAEYMRDIPLVKTTNYLQSASLAAQMKAAAAADVLYHDRGQVYECSRSNVFIVKDNVLITPNEKILQGITRRKVLSLTDTPYDIELRPVTLDEVYGSDEVFITSTIKKVLPIVKIDDRVISDGLVGPVAKYLMEQSIF